MASYSAKRIRDVLHASLLPRYRGGAPLNWAVLNGDFEAGLSMFELGAGLDEGASPGQTAIAVAPDDNIGVLISKVEIAACAFLDECISKIAAGLPPYPQSGTPSYSLQRIPEHVAIDWTQSAVAISRLVRAVTRPYPGAFSRLGSDVVTIWQARPGEGLPIVFGKPGQIAVFASCTGTNRGDGRWSPRGTATLADDASAIDWLRSRNQQRFELS